ncbi:MAG: anti-sigma factor [Candidatus Nephrothrix sp. EaCA]|nr:MAG: anti-sigma factor [Candidatus Nephrothrix sp. EaCA]
MNFQYKIACSLQSLQDIRQFIRQSLVSMELSDAELGTLVLAMDEICSNLIIHAHQCDEYHEVEIRIEVPDKKSVVFEVIDDKAIFDINKYQAMPLNEIVHERRRGGLGVRLVKSIMDNVEYYNRNGKFVCRLTKSYH